MAGKRFQNFSLSGQMKRQPDVIPTFDPFSLRPARTSLTCFFAENTTESWRILASINANMSSTERYFI